MEKSVDVMKKVVYIVKRRQAFVTFLISIKNRKMMA